MASAEKRLAGVNGAPPSWITMTSACSVFWSGYLWSTVDLGTETTVAGVDQELVPLSRRSSVLFSFPRPQLLLLQIPSRF